MATVRIFRSLATWHLGHIFATSRLALTILGLTWHPGFALHLQVLGLTLNLQVLGYMASFPHFASSGLGLHCILATLRIFMSWATSRLVILATLCSSCLGLHCILATLRTFWSWTTCHLGYTSHLQVLGYVVSWLHFASSGLGLHGILATVHTFSSWATCHLGYTSHLQVLGLLGILATLHIFWSWDLGYALLFRCWATWHLGYSSHLQVLWYLASWLHFASSGLGILATLCSSGLGLHGILATLHIFMSWGTWHLGHTSHFEVFRYTWANMASWLYFASSGVGVLGILATLRIFRSWATSRLVLHLGYTASWLHFASSCLGLHGILATIRILGVGLHFASAGLGLHGIFRSWATWHLGYTSHLQVLGYMASLPHFIFSGLGLLDVLRYTWGDMASWLHFAASVFGLHFASSCLRLHGILATLPIFTSWATSRLTLHLG